MGPRAEQAGGATILGNSRTTSWHAVEHAVRTQIFVDVRPVNAVAIANQRPVRPLGRRGLREAPRPGERNANDTTIDEVGRNVLVGHFDVIDKPDGQRLALTVVEHLCFGHICVPSLMASVGYAVIKKP